MQAVFYNVNDGRLNPNIGGYIQELIPDTDIFCFQESYYQWPGTAQELLCNYTQARVEKHVSEKDTFGQHTFSKNSYPISTYEEIISSPIAGAAIYTAINMKGNLLHIVNVHGISRPTDKLDCPVRLIQSREIIEFLSDKTEPIIVGGDFNLFRDTKSIKLFAENGFSNLIELFDIATTRNPHAWVKYKNRMHFDSDYIFLKGDIKVNSFKVPFNLYSDHLPLILGFSIF